jgi:hypothetical protein
VDADVHESAQLSTASRGMQPAFMAIFLEAVSAVRPQRNRRRDRERQGSLETTSVVKSPTITRDANRDTEEFLLQAVLTQ